MSTPKQVLIDYYEYQQLLDTEKNLKRKYNQEFEEFKEAFINNPVNIRGADITLKKQLQEVKDTIKKYEKNAPIIVEQHYGFPKPNTYEIKSSGDSGFLAVLKSKVDYYYDVYKQRILELSDELDNLKLDIDLYNDRCFIARLFGNAKIGTTKENKL